MLVAWMFTQEITGRNNSSDRSPHFNAPRISAPGYRLTMKLEVVLVQLVATVRTVHHPRASDGGHCCATMAASCDIMATMSATVAKFIIMRTMLTCAGSPPC